MDFISMISNPAVIYLLSGVAVLLVAVLFLTRPKPTGAIVIERIRPHYNVIRNATESKSPNPGDTVLALPDKRKFIVPKEIEEQVEIVEVPKNVTIKKGFRKLWFLENNQIVKLGNTLTEAASSLITPEMIPVLLNRGSLKRLATAKAGGVQSWTMLMLAGAAAFAIGYILYPQFNHAPTIIEYCQKFANGTTGGCSPIP